MSFFSRPGTFNDQIICGAAHLRQTDSLQKAGDVIAATGRPDERVCLHGDVVGHQLGGLLSAGAACVPHAIMVHSEPKDPQKHTQRGCGKGWRSRWKKKTHM